MLAALRETPILGALFLGLIVTASVGVMLFIMARPESTIVERLSDAAYARGLITFLFTLGTIVIALVLALSAVNRQNGDSTEGFDRAKEILTVLVGILGTIIGFYFGSQSEAEQLGVSARLSAESAAESTQVTLVGFVRGGEPPYSYSVVSDSPTVLSELEAMQADNGWIMTDLSLGSVDQDTPLTVTVTARDASGASVQTALTLQVQDVPGAGG